MANSIWVLTEEYNDYNQHGAYFVTWFSYKPEASDVKQVLQSIYPELCGKDLLDLATHVADGGGRRNDEDNWYNLEERRGS